MFFYRLGRQCFLHTHTHTHTHTHAHAHTDMCMHICIYIVCHSIFIYIYIYVYIYVVDSSISEDRWGFSNFICHVLFHNGFLLLLIRLRNWMPRFSYLMTGTYTCNLFKVTFFFIYPHMGESVLFLERAAFL